MGTTDIPQRVDRIARIRMAQASKSDRFDSYAQGFADALLVALDIAPEWARAVLNAEVAFVESFDRKGYDGEPGMETWRHVLREAVAHSPIRTDSAPA